MRRHEEGQERMRRHEEGQERMCRHKGQERTRSHKEVGESVKRGRQETLCQESARCPVSGRVRPTFQTQS